MSSSCGPTEPIAFGISAEEARQIERDYCA